MSSVHPETKKQFLSILAAKKATPEEIENVTQILDDKFLSTLPTIDGVSLGDALSAIMTSFVKDTLKSEPKVKSEPKESRTPAPSSKSEKSTKRKTPEPEEEEEHNADVEVMKTLSEALRPVGEDVQFDVLAKNTLMIASPGMTDKVLAHFGIDTETHPAKQGKVDGIDVTKTYKRLGKAMEDPIGVATMIISGKTADEDGMVNHTCKVVAILPDNRTMAFIPKAMVRGINKGGYFIGVANWDDAPDTADISAFIKESVPKNCRQDRHMQMTHFIASYGKQIEGTDEFMEKNNHGFIKTINTSVMVTMMKATHDADTITNKMAELAD